MNPIIKRLGIWWLSGPKWTLSRLLAGHAWHVPILEALATRTTRVADLILASTLDEVVDVFRGLVHWRRDSLWQLWDRVYPPALLLARGGDDCDGMAMLHAQAVEYAMGPRGWRAAIGSYLADPWHLSHHVALAIDRAGLVWAIQPQSSKDQPQNVRLIYGPYPSCEEALGAIAKQYRAEIVWYDIRMPDGSPAPLDYPHHAA